MRARCRSSRACGWSRWATAWSAASAAWSSAPARALRSMCWSTARWMSAPASTAARPSAGRRPRAFPPPPRPTTPTTPRGAGEYRGAAIGWQSPTGFRPPGLHENADEGGLGWLRSFSGLLVTCGLDHTLFMDRGPAGHYHYGPRETVNSGLHGRVANIPARLTGYGERWEGDECILW